MSATKRCETCGRNLNWSERELEDWLWQHPEAMTSEPHGWEWVGRQCQVGPWRMDLLGHSSSQGMANTLVVVELKCREATAVDLAQTMRYMSAVQQATRSLPGSSCVGMIGDRIRGWLVAPSFDEDVLNATRWTSGLCCSVVRQTASGFELWAEAERDYRLIPMQTVRTCPALSAWFPTLDGETAHTLLHAT